MKKKIIIIISIILVFVIGGLIWMYCYKNYKRLDNIPSLALVEQEGEAFANEKLIGYSIDQLIEIWKEPTNISSGIPCDIWEIEKGYVYVNYNKEGIIENVKIEKKTITFEATILEIQGTQLLVQPIEDSQAFQNSTQISISMKNMDSSLEPQVGDVIAISYDGQILETYPLQLGEIYSITITKEVVQTDLIPMVMVNGEIYYDSGKESNVIERTDHVDGNITSQVKQNEKPTQDDQSNFGIGYGYQYGSVPGTIEICIDGKWWVFVSEEAK